MIANGPDLLRLALVPTLLWLAILDVRSRRVPGWVWWPLALVGVLALAWAGLEAVRIGGWVQQRWTLQVALSLGVIAPMGYLFYRVNAFGAADAKALVLLAVAYPTYPTLHVAGQALPLVRSDVGVFALAVLVNGVLLGMAYPLVLAGQNALGGRFRPAMFLGRPVHWSSLERRHGVFLEDAEGFIRRGLDLDALRMYLRWRDTDLGTIRADPARYADPGSLPETPGVPGDGRVRTDGGIDPDDRWGARRFLEEVEGAYGARPEELRAALDLVCERERLWISPGIPFLVPLVGGLVVALTLGDVPTLAIRLFL